MAKVRLHVRSFAPPSTLSNKLFSSDLIGVAAKRPNLDELDRIGFNQFSKRNLDELDRINFNTLDTSKRSFDELDRLSFNELDDAIFDMDKYPAHNWRQEMYGRDGRFTRKV